MDLKPIICSYVNNEWQTEWDLYKPHEISLNVEKKKSLSIFLPMGSDCLYPL